MSTFKHAMTLRELDENSPRAEQIPGTQIQMKAHQLSLLKACLDFELDTQSISDDPDEIMSSRVGVMGDKVGAGKSFVILSLLLSPIPKTYDCPYEEASFASNLIKTTRKVSRRTVHGSLLVVPHNLIQQWQDYIDSFMPKGARTLTINRARIIENVGELGDYDLVMVSSTFFGVVAKASERTRWKRMIIDETDSIKICNTTFVDACTYWFVTASFNNVLNPLGRNVLDRSTNRYVQISTGMRLTGFFKSMFNELHEALDPPHALAVIVVKNKDEFVDKSADLPTLKETIIKCLEPREIAILKGIVDQQIIQRLNANDVRGAISLISTSRRQSENNVINCLIESFDRKAKNIAFKIEYHKSIEYEDDNVRQNDIERLDIKRRQIVDRITAIRERISSSGTCPICYEDIDDKCVLTCCQNSFCMRCIGKWLSQTSKCPMCKTQNAITDMYVISSEVAIGTREVQLQSKVEHLVSLLREIKVASPSRKVIIFSGYDSTFDSTVIPVLVEEEMGYECLHGTGAHVALMTRKYRDFDSGLNVLLANALNFGSGLNLEVTTDIIMFHRLDTEIERQVIGRAQRPGRTSSLHVWYLLHENEL